MHHSAVYCTLLLMCELENRANAVCAVNEMPKRTPSFTAILFVCSFVWYYDYDYFIV